MIKCSFSLWFCCKGYTAVSEGQAVQVLRERKRQGSEQPLGGEISFCSWTAGRLQPLLLGFSEDAAQTGRPRLHLDAYIQENGDFDTWLVVITCRGTALVAQMVESACNAGDPSLIPGLGRSPGEGNGNPLQYSCLENSKDRGAWWVIIHRVAKSQTRLMTNTSTFTHAEKGW